MIEHVCDECGTSKIKACYCERHLDVIKEKAFNDGRAEGFEAGFEQAKKDLS